MLQRIVLELSPIGCVPRSARSDCSQTRAGMHGRSAEMPTLASLHAASVKYHSLTICLCLCVAHEAYLGNVVHEAWISPFLNQRASRAAELSPVPAADKPPLLCQCLQELARLAKKRAFLCEVTAGVLLSALEPLEAEDLGSLLGDCPGVVEFMSGTAEEGGPQVQAD